MKKTFFAIVALCAFAVLFSSCSKKRTLHVYIWADYISNEVIHEFEKQYNCRVQQDTFDSNEMMFAKLQAGGAGYDVVCPSHYFIRKMIGSGMLTKLDKDKLPNLCHLDQDIVRKLDDGCILDYSVPYFMSYTGLGYNKRLVKDFKPTWNIFLREDLKDRITVLDDYTEVIGAAARMMGYSFEDLNDPALGDARMDEVVNLAQEWRKNILKFDNEQYKNGLATGEFSIVMGYFSDLSQIVAENEDLALAMPVEGCMMSCDMLCIPATANDPELAYAFINFVHDPKNAARNISDVCAYCPNTDALDFLDEEVLSDESIFIDEEIIEKSLLVPEFTGEQEERYLRNWQRIRTGK